MQATAVVALLVMISGLGAVLPVQAAQQDSAHTLVQPTTPDPGRPGQVYQLPQGGTGVTTGGTSHYQTLQTPGGGSGVAVPNGNGTSGVIGSGGQTGTANTPR